MIGIVASLAAGQITTRVSVDSGGIEGDSWSYSYSSLSADGRFVAFASVADNLVAGDTNGVADVFVHDRATGRTERVSVSSSVGQSLWSAGEANEKSFYPTISADGRHVVFTSDASNLVLADTNGFPDTFVHDRWSASTTRVSVDSNGKEGNGWSNYGSAISGDGRYVAFTSGSTNLVSGDFNRSDDVFVHDRWTGKTTRSSVDSSDVEGNGHSFVSAISLDGRFVAFSSRADNLVGDDTNRVWDVFVHDCESGETSRVSLTSSGKQRYEDCLGASISTDARYVSFLSGAAFVQDDQNFLVDVYLRDRLAGITTRVSVDELGSDANGSSFGFSMSADASLIAFYSVASDLVSDDSNGTLDVFVRHLAMGRTVRVSVDSDGREGNDLSHFPAISADGRHVSFTSGASNLVKGDTNSAWDVFVHSELSLFTDTSIASEGERVTLTAYRGVAGHAASLWITKVGGAPLFIPVSLGAFGADGLFTVSGQAPPGLHAQLTLQCLAFDRDLEVAATNEVVVTLAPLDQR